MIICFVSCCFHLQAMAPKGSKSKKAVADAKAIEDVKEMEALELTRAQSNFAGIMSRAEPGSDQAKTFALYKSLPLRSDQKREIIKKWTEE